VVISEHQFYLLAERYKLSPTQRKIVHYLLSGIHEADDLARIFSVAPSTVQNQFFRVFKKMHLASKTDVLYRFVSDAKSIDP
jgi:DNA-binding CsgD family transcriptional regulator